MKNIFTKKLDKEGKLTIPKEIRENLDIDEGTLIELKKDGNGIQLHPSKKNSEMGEDYLEVLKRTRGGWT